MKKFLIKSILMIILLVVCSCKAAVFATYQDINGHWAAETIEKFVEKEYLISVDDKFEPDSEITKGEIATIINHYFAYGEAENEEEHLKIAIENGYLTESKIDETITREEIAVLICKALSLEPSEEEISFMDQNMISIWARGYVATLEKEKIMIGYPSQTYQPQKNITKAEFVTVLNRCIGAGGADMELIDTEITELEIGVFEKEDERIKFIPIGEELQMKVGDVLELALKVPEDLKEDEMLVITSKEGIVEWNNELYLLTALEEGKTELQVKTNKNMISVQIVVE